MARNIANVAAGTHQRSEPTGQGHAGLRFERYFTPPGAHAYDLVDWERRTASITNEKGALIFEQKDVEVPASWSQLAVNVVARPWHHLRALLRLRL